MWGVTLLAQMLHSVDMLGLDVIPRFLLGHPAQLATSNMAKEVVANPSLLFLIDHLIQKLAELSQLFRGADLSAVQPTLDRCKLLHRQHLHAIRHVIFGLLPLLFMNHHLYLIISMQCASPPPPPA
jgi:hypothetical protein